jgi:hypothetical protein
MWQAAHRIDAAASHDAAVPGRADFSGARMNAPLRGAMPFLLCNANWTDG